MTTTVVAPTAPIGEVAAPSHVPESDGARMLQVPLSGGSVEGARARLLATAARSWPTASALVFLYETTGSTPRVWRVFRVLGADGSLLREWEEAAGSPEGDADRAALALDSVLACAGTARSAGFPAPSASTTLMLHRLVLGPPPQ